MPNYGSSRANRIVLIMVLIIAIAIVIYAAIHKASG